MGLIYFTGLFLTAFTGFPFQDAFRSSNAEIGVCFSITATDRLVNLNANNIDFFSPRQELYVSLIALLHPKAQENSNIKTAV
jgi:hypothetical protein